MNHLTITFNLNATQRKDSRVVQRSKRLVFELRNETGLEKRKWVLEMYFFPWKSQWIPYTVNLTNDKVTNLWKEWEAEEQRIEIGRGVGGKCIIVDTLLHGFVHTMNRNSCSDFSVFNCVIVSFRPQGMGRKSTEEKHL